MHTMLEVEPEVASKIQARARERGVSVELAALNRLMKFEFAAPICFIAEGIVAENLLPLLHHLFSVFANLKMACRREDVDLTELLNELEHMVVDEKVNSAQLVSITRIDQAQLI